MEKKIQFDKLPAFNQKSSPETKKRFLIANPPIQQINHLIHKRKISFTKWNMELRNADNLLKVRVKTQKIFFIDSTRKAVKFCEIQEKPTNNILSNFPQFLKSSQFFTNLSISLKENCFKHRSFHVINKLTHQVIYGIAGTARKSRLVCFIIQLMTLLPLFH